MAEIDSIRAEVGKLQRDYERLNEDQLAHYKQALDKIASVLPYLPDASPRPETVPAIFGKSYDENFVSDYIAYAIDPERNGIGIEPLRQVLSLAGAPVDLIDFGSISIWREYTLVNRGRIDLLIRIDDQYLLGIENKVFAAENPGQTPGYVNALEKEFPDDERFYLFLTRDGHKARSRLFTPLSYEALYNALREVPYEWHADIRKSILWEDFLTHLREYIAIGGFVVELSEKSKLYLENYELIHDLEQAYDRDVNAIFNHVVEQLQMNLPPADWKFNFRTSRGWQQYFKSAWDVSDLSIHFEYIFSEDLLRRENFALMFEVERREAARFQEIFKKYLPELESVYEQKAISYRPSNRRRAIAWKQYDIEPDLDEIASQVLTASEEFEFLIPAIDETLAELRAQQAKTDQAE